MRLAAFLVAGENVDFCFAVLLRGWLSGRDQPTTSTCSLQSTVPAASAHVSRQGVPRVASISEPGPKAAAGGGCQPSRAGCRQPGELKMRPDPHAQFR